MSHLRACQTAACPKAQQRYSDRLPYCDVCGERRVPIEVCCPEEELGDTGYCGSCGMRKGGIRFLGKETV